MNNDEKDKITEINSLEELELINISKDEIYEIADLLYNVEKERNE